MNKRGVELSINAIIIIIISVLALLVILFIFNSAMRDFASSIFNRLKDALNLWNSTQIT